MPDIILHHYPRSPFSEKVRLVFGFKNVDWYSVEIPAWAPKPDLVPLTGGYRRTPVMQIGADIFCDTRLILREIDRRFPASNLHNDDAARAQTAAWADTKLFYNAVGIVMGTLADTIPQALKDDRRDFTGGRFDAGHFKQEQPVLRAAFREHLARIDTEIKSRAQAAPDIADFSLYHVLWFVRTAIKQPDFLEDFPATCDWYDRMTAFGHGRPAELTAKAALAVARDAKPAVEQAYSSGPDYPAGTSVSVAANDYGRDPVKGTIVHVDDMRIVIHRRDELAGDVNVHFPRTGFDITKQ